VILSKEERFYKLVILRLLRVSLVHYLRRILSINPFWMKRRLKFMMKTDVRF
jgi:hypothetical protein